MKCADCGKQHRGIGGLMPKRKGFRSYGRGTKPAGRFPNYDDGQVGLHGHVTYDMVCKECLEKRPKPVKEPEVDDAPF